LFYGNTTAFPGNMDEITSPFDVMEIYPLLLSYFNDKIQGLDQ